MRQLLAAYFIMLLLQIPVVGGVLGADLGLFFYTLVDLSAFVFAIILYLRNPRPVRWNGYILFLVCYLGYAFASSAWSSSPDVAYGLMLLLRDTLRIVTVMFCLAVMNYRGTEDVLRLAVPWALLLFVVISALTMSYAYDFQDGVGRLMYKGYKDANGVSHAMALLIMLSVWVLHGGKAGKSLYIGTFSMGVLLLLVFSKTTVVALFFSVVLAFYFLGEKVARKIIYLLVSGFVLGAVVAFKLEYIRQYLFEVQGGGALLTLSGRVGIWDVALDNLSDVFVFGAGVNSFAHYSKGLLENVPGQIHNELLQIVFSYGLVGFILYACVQYGLYSISRKLKDHSRRLAICLLVFYFIAGLTEANLVSMLSPMWLILFITYMSKNVAAHE